LTADPYDEQNILANDTVIRRVSLQYVVPNENTGGQRLSSMLFQPSSGLNGGMSVDIEAKIVEAGLVPRDYVTNPTFMGSVSMKANSIRSLDLIVGYDPIPENAFHGEVWGSNVPNRFTGAQKKGLRAESEWYVEIPGVEIG
jgi:hypothetical protein